MAVEGGPDPRPLLPQNRGDQLAPPADWALDDYDNDISLLTIITDGPRHRTTPARWFVLFAFCLLSLCQNMLFNAYSPVLTSVLTAFPSWDQSFLDWTVNTANIAYVLGLYPALKLSKLWGVRRITVVSAAVIFFGAALRCVPVPDGPAQMALTIVSMVFNGVGAAWLGFGGPVVADLWFPTGERTLATSLGAIVAPYGGTSAGFILGPAIAGGDPPDEVAARMTMDQLFWTMAAVCLVALACCVAYFPDRPEYPPSEAAAEEREKAARRLETASLSASSGGSDDEDEEQAGERIGGVEDAATAEGDARLLSDEHLVMEAPSSPGIGVYFGCSSSFRANEPPPAGAILKYWAICIGLSFPLGVVQGWGSVLYSILAPLGATEDQAAALGVAATLGGCVGAVVVGAALGRCAGQLKAAAVSLMGVAALSFLIFSAAAVGYLPIPGDAAAVLAFATGAIAGTAFSASVPLCLELIVENAHGWADGGSGVMMVSLLSCVVQIVFTAALAIQQGAGGRDGNSGSTAWTSWTAAGSAVLGCIALLGVRVEYRRLSIDRGTALTWTGCRFDREFGCY